jgi:hypothetical protein
MDKALQFFLINFIGGQQLAKGSSDKNKAKHAPSLNSLLVLLTHLEIHSLK